MRRGLGLWVGSILVLTLARGSAAVSGAESASAVLVNGTAVPGAKSEVSIEKEVLEFRDGNTGETRLVPGAVTYGVCIDSSALIASIEAACAPDAQNPYLDVTVEDGRSFRRCLVTSSRTARERAGRGTRRVTTYCFRCEGPG